VVGALLLPGLPAMAGETVELRLAAALAGPGDRRSTAALSADGPGGALAAASGVDTFPTGCVTPLFLAAGSETTTVSDAMRQAMAGLATLTVLPEERQHPTRDGHFLLHYARDTELTPESLARIAEALVAARGYLTGTLAYPDPAPAGERVQVYLVHLGHGLEGFVVPARGTDRSAGGTLLLDSSLPTDRIMPAVLHQVAHLSLLSLAAGDTWWHEATASFLTLYGTSDYEGARAALRARLTTPATSLASDGLLEMQGALLWPLFLAERTGDPGIVRRIWAEVAAGSGTLAAADAVLKQGYGLSLPAALREMVIWNLQTGTRDDGQHYSAARQMPEAALVTLGPALPLQPGSIQPVEPMASMAFRLPEQRLGGSLRITLRAQGGQPAADMLMFRHDDGDRPLLVPVPMDHGIGEVSVPWSGVREAWIVMRNEADPEGGDAAQFELEATHDPFAPFDLAGFTAEAVGRTVVLQWTTASEKGMVGWNLYRADRPVGPFARINTVALPAYGDGASDTGYLFVDEGATPGRRYYYLVEGVTSAGLVERSHLASARINSR
jgi:hypothetical protein